jgi:large subunit ribosomal protein L19
MDKNILKNIEEGQLQKRPDVMVGDTVKLHIKIKEGNKERVQIFEGVVIAIKGSGIDTSITVRKISYGIGVEKILPLHTPVLQKIEIVKRGTVRRAKLYFLRDRVGRRALKVNNIKSVYMTDEADVPVTGEAIEDVVVEETVSETPEEVVEEKTEA